MQKYKKSIRGLTFSLESSAFPVGSRFAYQISVKENLIRIVRSTSGNTVSRKKSGKKVKSLFDLRSKNVMELMAKCDYFEVEPAGDEIIVRFCKKKVFSILRKKAHEAGEVLDAACMGSILLPVELVKKVSGGSPLYTQFTIDDYIRSMEAEEEKQIKKEIPLIFQVISLFSGVGMLDKPFGRIPIPAGTAGFIRTGCARRL